MFHCYTEVCRNVAIIGGCWKIIYGNLLVATCNFLSFAVTTVSSHLGFVLSLGVNWVSLSY